MICRLMHSPSCTTNNNYLWYKMLIIIPISSPYPSAFFSSSIIITELEKKNKQIENQPCNDKLRKLSTLTVDDDVEDDNYQNKKNT